MTVHRTGSSMICKGYLPGWIVCICRPFHMTRLKIYIKSRDRIMMIPKKQSGMGYMSQLHHLKRPIFLSKTLIKPAYPQYMTRLGTAVRTAGENRDLIRCHAVPKHPAIQAEVMIEKTGLTSVAPNPIPLLHPSRSSFIPPGYIRKDMIPFPK